MLPALYDRISKAVDLALVHYPRADLILSSLSGKCPAAEVATIDSLQSNLPRLACFLTANGDADSHAAKSQRIADRTWGRDTASQVVGVRSVMETCDHYCLRRQSGGFISILPRRAP